MQYLSSDWVWVACREQTTVLLSLDATFFRKNKKTSRRLLNVHARSLSLSLALYPFHIPIVSWMQHQQQYHISGANAIIVCLWFWIIYFFYFTRHYSQRTIVWREFLREWVRVGVSEGWHSRNGNFASWKSVSFCFSLWIYLFGNRLLFDAGIFYPRAIYPCRRIACTAQMRSHRQKIFFYSELIRC